MKVNTLPRMDNLMMSNVTMKLKVMNANNHMKAANRITLPKIFNGDKLTVNVEGN